MVDVDSVERVWILSFKKRLLEGRVVDALRGSSRFRTLEPPSAVIQVAHYAGCERFLLSQPSSNRETQSSSDRTPIIIGLQVFSSSFSYPIPSTNPRASPLHNPPATR